MQEKKSIKDTYKNKITFLDTKEKSYTINMLEEKDKNKFLSRILTEKEVYKISNEAYSILDKLMRLPLICVSYGRVSTNNDDQQNSLNSQIYYFLTILNQSSNLWNMKTLYADEGISGTQFKNRKAFNQMVDDAMSLKFDLILIKDVSRFARNTVDCLQTIRKLSEKGIIVYFITDRIISIEPDAEIRITEAVKHAQEESRRQSIKVKFGMDVKASLGSPLGHRCFGFDLNKNMLVISEKQAEQVKEWGNLVMQGYSQYQIRKEMERRNEKTPSGLSYWDNVDIYEMLKNPKLKGDILYKKEIVLNYLEHKTIKNDGRVPQIYKENTHEPIFTNNQHNAIIKEIESRSPIQSEEEKRKYSNRYPFSGKIFCGTCNHTFYRKSFHRKKEKENFVWNCSENIRNGLEKENDKGQLIGCNNKAIHEPVLKEIFVQSLEHVIEHKDIIIKDIKSVVKKALQNVEPVVQTEKKLNFELTKIKNSKLSTIELYNDKSIDKSTLTEMLNKYIDRENQLLDELQKIKNKTDSNDIQILERQDSIYLAIDKLMRISSNGFSDVHCKNLLHKIVVYNRNKIEIYFKGDDETPKIFDGYPPLLVGKEDLELSFHFLQEYQLL